MAIKIAVANHKGGVAKTASVGAFGTIFAAAGYKVLMVDLDTQANLTYSFIDIENNMPARFLHDAIRERKNIPQVEIKENLFLVPSSLEMTLFESEMYSMRRREYVLQDLILPVENKYDIIIFDCPPSLALMTTNALTIVDRLIVPMTVDQLSYNGLKMMAAYVESLNDMNPHLDVNDVFFTRYDNREKLTRKWEPVIREEFGNDVLKSVIHKNVKISEAVSIYRSVVDYDPESQGAIDYNALAMEIHDRMKNDYK